MCIFLSCLSWVDMGLLILSDREVIPERHQGQARGAGGAVPARGCPGPGASPSLSSSSALTAAPSPSVLPSPSLAAAASDKVTASEAWNLLHLQFYFQHCSGSSPLC